MIRYTVVGTDGKGREFKADGLVTGTHNILDIDLYLIGAHCFEGLTGGRARYGHPGKGGCTGPYDLKSLTLEKQPEA